MDQAAGMGREQLPPGVRLGVRAGRRASVRRQLRGRPQAWPQAWRSAPILAPTRLLETHETLPRNEKPPPRTHRHRANAREGGGFRILHGGDAGRSAPSRKAGQLCQGAQPMLPFGKRHHFGRHRHPGASWGLGPHSAELAALGPSLRWDDEDWKQSTRLRR